MASSGASIISPRPPLMSTEDGSVLFCGNRATMTGRPTCRGETVPSAIASRSASRSWHTGGLSLPSNTMATSLSGTKANSVSMRTSCSRSSRSFFSRASSRLSTSSWWACVLNSCSWRASCNATSVSASTCTVCCIASEDGEANVSRLSEGTFSPLGTFSTFWRGAFVAVIVGIAPLVGTPAFAKTTCCWSSWAFFCNSAYLRWASLFSSSSVAMRLCMTSRSPFTSSRNASYLPARASGSNVNWAMVPRSWRVQSNVRCDGVPVVLRSCPAQSRSDGVPCAAATVWGV
mmetsp:Transcript_19347/g.50405  ORF Transcript_19347/g.50405 Transcript_19347/m.50405 type:complete len:289 (-) Transcript_19347:114-980(-)